MLAASLLAEFVPSHSVPRSTLDSDSKYSGNRSNVYCCVGGVSGNGNINLGGIKSICRLVGRRSPRGVGK